jgi:hypothetical protein
MRRLPPRPNRGPKRVEKLSVGAVLDLDAIEARINVGPPRQWKDLSRAPWTIQLEKDARALLAELRKLRG